MSVKNKVKRCNAEIQKLNNVIKNLKSELKAYELSNSRLRDNLSEQVDNKLLENIVKFALTNHIGGLYGGITIERTGIDKMKDLKLDMEYEPRYNSYIMRVYYKGDIYE